MFRNLRALSFVVVCVAAFGLAAGPSPVRGQGTANHQPTASAATNSASIWGNVTDNHGAPLGGAKVTLLNEDTKESTGGSTDGTGQYHFEGLRAGKYTVSFDAHGFVPKQHEVKLKPGTKKVEVNERLKPPPEPEPKAG
jgi:Carboxypeptidase regulatory-like domain